MATPSLKPIRRVVAANDERGRSKVMWDGPAPDTHAGAGGANGWTDFWVWNESPPPLAGGDDGSLPYDFPGPPNGGHFRAVQGQGRPADYEASRDARLMPFHEPKERPAGRTWDRGGRNIYTSDMHKTETVDYAIIMEGERRLILDDAEVDWRPGDVVVQVGAYHQWSSPAQGGIVAYDMIAARFVDGPAGVAQGHDRVLTADLKRELPGGATAARRIVTIDRVAGKGSLVTDGPSPDVRIDPARPGFSASRMWVTDSHPAKIVFETLHLPHTIEPPPGGSVLRVVHLPPDDAWKGKAGQREVQAYFQAMGSPRASTYSPLAPHPYMQKTRTLDFAIVLEGEAVLVLDMQEVPMRQGEVAILRAANHAWSNRSSKRAVLAIASHDGKA
ncbi:MAG: hypothetical protein ACXW2I_12525 [Burkholderiales bacterium]